MKPVHRQLVKLYTVRAAHRAVFERVAPDRRQRAATPLPIEPEVWRL
jgi:hypothetical protein